MIGPWELALYAFGALTLLLIIGMPIAFAMILVGVGGVTALIGFQPALALLGQIPVSNTMSYELSVVPMFILMGTFISRSGISGDLYDACNAFVGHRRGGLAIATIMACGAFGAPSSVVDSGPPDRMMPLAPNFAISAGSWSQAQISQ